MVSSFISYEAKAGTVALICCRRSGWLDLVLVKYSHVSFPHILPKLAATDSVCKDVNGYTCLNLTKLDVLDTFPTIKVRQVSRCLSGDRTNN
jgi:adenylosuccinate synthase